jgi:hypothetical protein
MGRFDFRFAVTTVANIVGRLGLVDFGLGRLGLGSVLGEESAEDHWGKIIEADG